MATVFVTALMPEQGPPTVKLLSSMARDFRRELSRSCIRRVPELRFRYDDSVDKGEPSRCCAATGRRAELTSGRQPSSGRIVPDVRRPLPPPLHLPQP